MITGEANSILITGGAGYIGSHTAKLLSESGYRPVTIDNLCTGVEGRVRWGPFIRANISDADAVGKALEEYGVETVVHLAAHAQAGDSMSQPGAYFQNNVSATLSLLDTMVARNVRRLVFASSCSVYGVVHCPIASEVDRAIPASPYGESKIICEQALNWYGRAHNLRWVAMRYFNVAGVEPDSGLGEHAAKSTRVVPRVISAALGRDASFSIFGTEYDTPDGTAVRDYVHVADIASANLAAVRYLEAGGQRAVINIGAGNGVSVRQIVDEVNRACGHPVEVIERPARAGDPPRIVAANDRALELLQWRPLRSTLPEIVESALAWHRSSSL